MFGITAVGICVEGTTAVVTLFKVMTELGIVFAKGIVPSS